ncbi:hypothetical protein CH373_15135 [Leptospira perolatii]|uniref:Uncharacterized protein n=1 Tax=Leptospira perolatii TaxID=2023191 RepID=A0A2M9ZJM3_9LEPT|nr:hypothetical protein CH360_10475 [Leptospira perolatii]PJZ72257.1 hypothetical protein CH373_15135 [Leptospira perolatii]
MVSISSTILSNGFLEWILKYSILVHQSERSFFVESLGPGAVMWKDWSKHLVEIGTDFPDPFQIRFVLHRPKPLHDRQDSA